LAGTRLFLQSDQLELIELGEEFVERRLIHDVAEHTARVARRRRAPPRTREIPEDAGLGVPDEHLVRGIVDGVAEAAERRLDLREALLLPTRLGPVPDEVRHVLQRERCSDDRDVPSAHAGTSHTVPGSTSVPRNSRARSTTRTRSACSSPTARDGSPVGLVIDTPRSTRFAPTICPMVGSAVTNTVVIPIRSISFASVAPQRVPVPQVPVRITASTPASRSSSAI